MDWVPHCFIDDVCHQLEFELLWHISQISESWSTIGSEHHKKRRECSFRFETNCSEARYAVEKLEGNKFYGQVYDLDSTYDRITFIFCDGFLWDQKAAPGKTRIPLEEFQSDVVPIIASLAANCSWPGLPRRCPENYIQNRLIFNAFKNCPGLSNVSVVEQGEESRDFVLRQVEIGNVQKLSLQNHTPTTWPEPEKLAKTLKAFVSSARFKKLLVFDRLPNNFELVELFLDRALAGELKKGAFILIESSNVDRSRFIGLHPEHREETRIAWRIPNSNRTVLEESAAFTRFSRFSLKVQ